MKKFLYIWLGALALVGCANRGIGPQGGPKDTIPPQPVRSVPENGVVSFDGKQIEVLFNEYLQLDNVSQNLLMSPPQQNPPEVKARGKKLTVSFVDSLRENTTYTLDFGNAVCDFTEKNPLRGYSFAFSTGPFIDTLEARGCVVNAENLNPVPGVLVGIHSDLSDDAFASKPFDRIARTDSAGQFRIGNIHEGTYRLYALNDVSRDYRFTISEGLAYADEPFTPSVRPHFHTDSLGNDSLVGYEYSPADLQLWFFSEAYQRLYLQRTLREEQHRIQLLFSSEVDSVPVLRALRPSEVDTAATDSLWVDPMPYILPEYSRRNDTVTLWLTDSIAIRQDSLFFEARYRRTDSLYRLEWYTDTLRAIWRAPRLTAKAREAQERRNRNRRLELKSNARQNFELYDTLRVTCTTPLEQILTDSIRLYERIDSVLVPVPFTLETSQMSFRVLANLGQGKRYELQIDSAALRDVYGIANLYTSYSLSLKTPEDYSTLRIHLTTPCPQARLQLLDTKDHVVREQPVEAGEVLFQYLKPDTYYLRLYIDADGDGHWTTGSWDNHRQPEQVYYFPQKIQTKSNWDFEESWDYTAVPQLEAKPKELIKTANKTK